MSWHRLSDSLSWSPGHVGKGFLLHDGTIKTWCVDPYHPVDQRTTWEQNHELSPIALNFEIDPDGGVVTDKPTVKVDSIIQADPRLYDAGQRPVFEDDFDLDHFEPKPDKEGKPDFNYIMSAWHPYEHDSEPWDFPAGIPGIQYARRCPECETPLKWLHRVNNPATNSGPRDTYGQPVPTVGDSYPVHECPNCQWPHRPDIARPNEGYTPPLDITQQPGVVRPDDPEDVWSWATTFGGPHYGAWHLADGPYGYTNGDTSEVILTMDNDRELSEASRKLVENGATPEQLRDWAIRKIISPHNRQQIKDAQEWNAIPLEERQRMMRQHDIDQFGEEAVNIGEGLMQPFHDWANEGKDEDEIRREQEYEAPDLIDPELVNWDEVHQGILDEFEENSTYDREMQERRDLGLGWATNHDLPTNQMRDAFMRSLGALPEEEIGGTHSQYSADPRYERNVQHNIPFETLQQIPGWERDYVDKARDALWQHRYPRAEEAARQELLGRGISPEKVEEVLNETGAFRPDYVKQHFPGGKYDTPLDLNDPEEASIFWNSPAVRDVQQNGKNVRPSDLAWDVLNAVKSGRPHPYIPQMQMALQQRGYAPEQIAGIMQQQYRYDPEINRNVPLNPPVEQWEQQAQEQQRLDQPGDLTIPEDWTRSSAETGFPAPAVELAEWLADLGGADITPPSIHHDSVEDLISAPAPSRPDDLPYFPPAHVPKEYAEQRNAAMRKAEGDQGHFARVAAMKTADEAGDGVNEFAKRLDDIPGVRRINEIPNLTIEHQIGDRVTAGYANPVHRSELGLPGEGMICPNTGTVVNRRPPGTHWVYHGDQTDYGHGRGNGFPVTHEEPSYDVQWDYKNDDPTYTRFSEPGRTGEALPQSRLWPEFHEAVYNALEDPKRPQQNVPDQLPEHWGHKTADSPITQADATNDPLGKNPAMIPSRQGDPDYLKAAICPHCYQTHRPDEPCPDSSVAQYEQMQRQWGNRDNNSVHGPQGAPQGVQDHQMDLGKVASDEWGTESDLSSPYTGWIPTDALTNEFNRNVQGDPAKVERVKQSLLTHGFLEPVWVDYHPETKMAYVSEGNHRITAARDAGIPAVPAKVLRSTRVPRDQSVLRGPYEYVGNEADPRDGYPPQYMHPRDIGLPEAQPWSPGRSASQVRQANPDWESMTLFDAINALRPQMAAEAQKVYDAWQPEDEFDDFGDGGICDAIANEALSGVIAMSIPDVELRDGGWEGDDHAYVIAMRDGEEVVVDIPARTYETGAGYSWEKIPGVQFTPDDVLVDSLTPPPRQGSSDQKMSAKTRTQQLQEKLRFEQEFGPDRAPVFHQFPDGWSLRKLNTSHSEAYEGELQPNCLGSASSLRQYVDQHLYHQPSEYGSPMASLRDPDNLPHASFIHPTESDLVDPRYFSSLDIEGGHGSNAGKYIPYIHDYWTKQLGRPPMDPNQWLSEYGMDPTQVGDPQHQAEPADSWQEYRPGGFWNKPDLGMPFLKRAVKPIQKAWQRIENGENLDAVLGDLQTRLLHNYKPEQVGYMLDDVREQHKRWQEYQPYNAEQMRPPSRVEFPEFYWMHGQYGPNVMNAVQQANNAYRGLHWNTPDFALGQLRYHLDQADIPREVGDQVSNAFWDAHRRAYQQRAGYDPGEMPPHPDDVEEERIRQQALDLQQPPSVDETTDQTRSSKVVKTSDKLHDFLMNPKSRPDLQTPEGQQWLKALEYMHGQVGPKIDPLTPWLTREWKRGRIQHDLDSPGYNPGVGRLRYMWMRPDEPDPHASAHAMYTLSPDRLGHWADFHQTNHPVRRGLGDINSHDITSFHNQVEAWGQAMAAEAQAKALEGGQVIHTTPEGYTVRQLTTPEELKAEGDTMGHCVGNYAPAVASGRSLIYSLRDPKGFPHATTEIEPTQYREREPDWLHEWTNTDPLDSVDAAIRKQPEVVQGLYQYDMEKRQFESGMIKKYSPEALKWQGLFNELESKWNQYLSRFGRPEQGKVVQIQGRDGEPKPEYQQQLRHWFESFPEEERPQWDGSYTDDDYISHPSDIQDWHLNSKAIDNYGLQRPDPTYDYRRLLEGTMEHNRWAGDSYDSGHGERIYQLARAHGEIPGFSKEFGRWADENQDNFNNWIDQNHHMAPGRRSINPETDEPFASEEEADEAMYREDEDWANEMAREHPGMEANQHLYGLLAPHWNGETYQNEPVQPPPVQQQQPQGTFS